MEIILIILTSTLIGALFVCAIEYGRRLGIKQTEDKNKEQVIEITKRNQKEFKKVVDMANFNG